MPTYKKLGLFDAVGIEIEYMIVEKDSLDIKPISDRILKHLSKSQHKLQNEIKLGDIAISNELVMHVIELKTNGPKNSIKNLDLRFENTIQLINSYLNEFSCQLLPTGAHPLLLQDNNNNIKLWPHGDKSIYETYNGIFNCQGHGWSNLQSMHINLPFASDTEFHQLHNAIRALLPIIPALTASTPILENRINGVLDNRLLFYGKNQSSIPEISGMIIPEVIQNKDQYISEILAPMYKAISPYDPKKILQHEWLNSRGAIARFDRNAIEIRIVDSQECPKADIACAAAIIAVLKHLVYDTNKYLHRPLESNLLHKIYKDTIGHGMNTIIDETSYLDHFDLTSAKTARELWLSLIDNANQYIDTEYLPVINDILKFGNLSERIISATDKDDQRNSIKRTYTKLSECLLENKLFL